MSSFTKILSKYGLAGLKIYLNLNLQRLARLKVPRIKQPIALRPKSSDITVFKHIFIHDDYDFELKQEPKIIIDAGANIGMSSILFANKYPGAKIYAIELSPANYQLLNRNTAGYENIFTYNNGLWPISELLNLDETAHSHWGQRVSRESGADFIQIPSLTMDTLMAENTITEVDLLKIDIEGAEEELFSRNFEEWLPRVKNIIIEFHDRIKPHSSEKIRAVLGKYKFEELGKVGENNLFINSNFS